MDPDDDVRPQAAIPGARRKGELLHRWIDQPATHNRMGLVALIAGLVVVVGIADYLTGFEVSLLIFYFIPVCIAVAGIGWRTGLVTAVASVATWIAADYLAGAEYRHVFVLVWNALIALSAYCVVVWLFSNLISMHREMEERIRQRTAALTEEIAERERLEKAVLEISERERRSIGHDLHDGLGQHLTGTALIGKALVARLREDRTNAAAEVERVVTLVERGIEQSRALAKGLLLAEIERDGLADALQELALSTRMQFNVACDYTQEGEPALEENGSANHLYRIAHEAVRNAIRHGRAKHIGVRLSAREGNLEMEVRDDGIGLPPAQQRTDGLGLRIMAHRASMIGASLVVERVPEGGTRVVCRIPQEHARRSARAFAAKA
jgi:signal transduction histidine kinase